MSEINELGTDLVFIATASLDEEVKADLEQEDENVDFIQANFLKENPFKLTEKTIENFKKIIEKLDEGRLVGGKE